MQNAEWINLFRQLPQEVHNKLVLVAQNRMEIPVERLFRVDTSCLAMRGRMGGPTEAGLVVMVPYSNIETVYVNREVAEDEVQALLGACGVSKLAVPSQQGQRLNGSYQGNGK